MADVDHRDLSDRRIAKLDLGAWVMITIMMLGPLAAAMLLAGRY
jgi:hypothetical protein